MRPQPCSAPRTGSHGHQEPRIVVDVLLDVAGVGRSTACLLGLRILMPSLELLEFGLEVSQYCLKALRVLLKIGGPMPGGQIRRRDVSDVIVDRIPVDVDALSLRVVAFGLVRVVYESTTEASSVPAAPVRMTLYGATHQLRKLELKIGWRVLDPVGDIQEGALESLQAIGCS